MVDLRADAQQMRACVSVRGNRVGESAEEVAVFVSA
jgi:hypothetical protein